MFRSSPSLPRHARGEILFGPLFFIGIIAAIAVPAYQDYTIRAQVVEGLNLASAAKATVAEYYASTGKWPASLKDAGLVQPLKGRYVSSVDINHGTIVIRYGALANSMIRSHQLTLRPIADSHQGVSWSCGYGEVAGSDRASGPAAPHKTDIAPKYLPRACRG